MFLADSVFVPDEQGELVALASTTTETVQALPPSELGAALVKMLVTLVALVLLLFASYWFLRRLIQNRLQKGVGKQAIQILEKRMLSPKTMLYIVEVENKKILLAESHLEVKRVETFPSEAPQDPIS